MALLLVSCLKSLPNTELNYIFPRLSLHEDPGDYTALEAISDLFIDIIDDNTRQTCVNVTIIDDDLLEEPEFFSIAVVPDPFVINFPSSVQLDPDVTFVEILDNDGKFL